MVGHMVGVVLLDVAKLSLFSSSVSVASHLYGLCDMKLKHLSISYGISSFRFVQEL